MPELAGCRRGEQSTGLIQQPQAIVPNPVTFGEAAQKRDQEHEIILDQLFYRAIGGVGLGEVMPQDPPTVVPDGVVLGIAAEQIRDLFQCLIRVVMLSNLASSQRDGLYSIGTQSPSPTPSVQGICSLLSSETPAVVVPGSFPPVCIDEHHAAQSVSSAREADIIQLTLAIVRVDQRPIGKAQTAPVDLRGHLTLSI